MQRVDLVSLKDGFSLESPAGRLHARILASVAEYETEVRAERVAAGQAVARKKGKQWGGSEKGWRWKVSDDQVNAIHEMRRAQKPILALGILEQISRSEDEVSKALAPIFAKAVPHSQEELQRARERRELVNPPGKNTNPIGDQLTWEQILIRFQEKRRLWIISRDGDYGTVFDDKGFLNRFLYDELCNVASAPEADLFADTVEGIRHFVDTTGVKAEKRLRNRRRITSVFPNSQAAYNERMVLSVLCWPKALQFAQPRATPALPWAGRTGPLRGEAVEDLWKLFFGRSLRKTKSRKLRRKRRHFRSCRTWSHAARPGRISCVTAWPGNSDAR